MTSPIQSPPVEVFYNGHLYRRYPSSAQPPTRCYYRPVGPGSSRRTSLHRQVYIDTYGEIPVGHDVHHKDEDKFNNHPANLEALPHSSHMSHHHGSLNARQWKALAQRKWWHTASPVLTCVCERCGSAFTVRGGKVGRYCSNKCRCAAFEHDPSYKTVERACEWCDAVFLIHRHRRAATRRFCSVACRNRANTRARWDRKREQGVSSSMGA